MLCQTCKSLLNSLKEPNVWVDHHKNLSDLQNSMAKGCSWCLKLWERCDMESSPPKDIVCNFRGILDQLPDRFLLSFYPGDSADSKFSKRYKNFSLLLEPYDGRQKKETNYASDTTFSRKTHACAERWLTTCLKEHDACNVPLRDRKLPSRLVEIGAPGTSVLPRLVESKHLPLHTEYMALSHCWGKETFFCLQKSNLAALKETIPLDKLSRVFQDALLVLRRFGMRYIWIDSICIIQDDITDWQLEAGKMGDVYRHSICNLAATAFHDGRHGLFVNREISVPHTEIIHINTNILWKDKPPLRRGTYSAVSFNLWRDAAAEAPLNQRAWVVQERLLSPRTLHFGSNELLWECHQVEACESFPNGLSEKIFTTKVKQRSPLKPNLRGASSVTEGQKAELYSSWSDVVSVYTAGNLSHEEDKLVAISGLATRFKELLHDGEYLAGLWKWNLIHQLLWEAHPESIWGRTFSKRPKEYRAPSWSWASIDGEIMTDSLRIMAESDYHLFAEILDAKVTAVDNNPFGQVTSGILTLRGTLVDGAMFIDEDTNYEPIPVSYRTYLFVIAQGHTATAVQIEIRADVTQSENTHEDLLDAEDEERGENVLQKPGALGPEIVWGVTRLTIFLPVRAKKKKSGDGYFNLEGLILEKDFWADIDGEEASYKRIGKFAIKEPEECRKFLSYQPPPHFPLMDVVLASEDHSGLQQQIIKIK